MPLLNGDHHTPYWPGPPAQPLSLVLPQKSPMKILGVGGNSGHHPQATTQGTLSGPSSPARWVYLLAPSADRETEAEGH